MDQTLFYLDERLSLVTSLCDYDSGVFCQELIHEIQVTGHHHECGDGEILGIS